MAGNIDTYVVDASFVLASLLPDEESPESDKFIIKYRNKEIKLISAPIFNLEVLNGLRAAKLSKRIKTMDEPKIFVERFIKLGIECFDVNLVETFLISEEKNLTVYDASYVWLAKSKNLPLLSLDKKMTKLAVK